MVNLADGAFVTGKTKAETAQRFASLHPGATGLMRLVGDVIGVTLAGNADDPSGSTTAADAAGADAENPDPGRPRNRTTPRWNGRRDSSRT